LEEGDEVAGEASLFAFCETQGEGVEERVSIEGDLPHLREAGVTRLLLHTQCRGKGK